MFNLLHYFLGNPLILICQIKYLVWVIFLHHFKISSPDLFSGSAVTNPKILYAVSWVNGSMRPCSELIGESSFLNERPLDFQQIKGFFIYMNWYFLR